MKNKSILLNILLFLFLCGCSTSKKITQRNQSLNGQWQIAESASGEDIPKSFPSTIQVPSFIDLAKPAFPKLNYPKDSSRYFWYRKEFSIDHKNAESVELQLRKVKYGAHVFVNGRKVGVQNICFSSVRMNIKEFLNKSNEKNELIIRVGTRENLPDTIISGADFEKKTFFPGIFDDVSLLLKNSPYIENVQIVPDINKNLVRAYVEIKQKNKDPFTINYQIVEHKSQKIVKSGSSKVSNDLIVKNTLNLEIPFENFELWSPENPFLYELKLTTDSDTETTRFGMRSFSVDTKNKQFLLNNNPYFMLGTNVATYRFFEDENRDYLPWNEDWVRKLFKQFKSMNWNSFRFHVGPAPDFWYDLADEMGLLIQDEYAVWYGKGGLSSLDKKITSDQLANEYEHWMRDRWNHPSIVIFDAQNETLSKITGPALEKVRGLDHSNRPWDNGYTKPMRETDIIEAHPYLFYPYHLKDAKVPEEGIMKALFGKVRLPSNDPNEQDPSADGKKYENTVLLNEYGWLWLNRDGSPTTLSENVYTLLFKEAKTAEEHFVVYSQTMAALTEYWRAHKKVAGILHFAGLTYSRPNEPRGQTSDCFKDLQSLEFNENFLKYVKPAFSKVAIMVNVWEKEYKIGQKLDVPIYVINDDSKTWKGNLKIALFSNETEIKEWNMSSEVQKNTVKVENIIIELPNKIGKFQLRVSLNFNSEEVTSYRNLNVQ
jgi:beta-galactosidase